MEYITRRMCFDYADDYEFSIDQKDDLWFFIQKMDGEFIPFWRKRQPKNKGAPSG